MTQPFVRTQPFAKTQPSLSEKDLTDFGELPQVQGKYEFQYPLAALTWFRVGGPSSVLFKPHDVNDLSLFLKNSDPAMPLFPLGAGSNLLVRDGGFKGCVIKLGGRFATIALDQTTVIVGAGCLDRTLALTLAENGLSGLEFLISIPGTLGGAVAMNAGAYGAEVKDYLQWIDIVDKDGIIKRLSVDSLDMSYRHCGGLPKGAIIVQVCFCLERRPKEQIYQRINDILQMRQETQPVKGRTGGSTFKNPTPYRAWELIDQAGCRGMTHNDAQVCEKHCNFLLNTHQATAHDLESLAEYVRQKVQDVTAVALEWEIIRLGIPA